MKKLTIVIDGVADRPIAALNYKTPLEAARTPNLDKYFAQSLAGTVRTIPHGLEVGSAVANLSLIGFDPATYQGRAVLEAAGVGIPTSPDNMYIRGNFVQFEGHNYINSHIKSYSAYDIETGYAAPLNRLLREKVFTDPDLTLHHVGSFRNILEVQNGRVLYPLHFAPAHDIIGQPIQKHLQKDGPIRRFYNLQEKSYHILQGNDTAVNGIWFWGASVVPRIQGDTKNRMLFAETLLMRGIAAVSGIPLYSCPDGLELEGLLQDKCEKVLSALRNGVNDAYIHIQECDDLAHELQSEKKMRAVERIDAAIGDLLQNVGCDFSAIVVSDHFTYSDNGAHGEEPVPFFLYHSNASQQRKGRYTEQCCRDAKYLVTAPELLALR